ncbi:hypothetical protein [Olivibacter sp. XZL3]|uniref:hypothetical protein n=1 Tax=Olivibacter sp. XZL3 TaxID=1735116 RepID=UPI001066679F|nr:hypothetical protein [Olivibacter sp. XZL3]
MNEPITIPLLKRLKEEGFTTLIASSKDGQDLVYTPSKEPARDDVMDDASVTALSEKELLGIDEVLSDFSYYQEKGIEIEVDEGE